MPTFLLRPLDEFGHEHFVSAHLQRAMGRRPAVDRIGLGETDIAVSLSAALGVALAAEILGSVAR